jgi:hypothetical protein
MGGIVADSVTARTVLGAMKFLERDEIRLCCGGYPARFRLGQWY